MLYTYKSRRREPKSKLLAVDGHQPDTEKINDRKIIDFYSGRRALESKDLIRSQGESLSRPLLSATRTDLSTGVAEWLVTIVLVLVLGLSLWLGMTWGF